VKYEFCVEGFNTGTVVPHILNGSNPVKLLCPVEIRKAGRGELIKLSTTSTHTHTSRRSFARLSTSTVHRPRTSKIPPHMNKSDVYPGPKLTVRIQTGRTVAELVRSLALHFFKESHGSEYSRRLLNKLLHVASKRTLWEFSCGVFLFSRVISNSLDLFTLCSYQLCVPAWRKWKKRCCLSVYRPLNSPARIECSSIYWFWF
jgi:hypothetical protein